jgi:septal ring factor EnvC (AmiA/AmiB activator)
MAAHRAAQTVGRLLALRLLCPVLLMLFGTSSLAQDAMSREEAESRLRALQTEIQQLQRSLTEARGRFAAEQEELRRIDLGIQDAALALQVTNQRIAGHRSELERLRAERDAYIDSLGARQDLLLDQIVAAYRMGRESRLKLLLNQDNPARLGRMLSYYDYFSKAQAEQIRELREAVATLDRMQLDINAGIARLDEAREQQNAELERLQARRSERHALLAGLAGQIEDDEVALAELTRNQADLEALIGRLADALSDIPADLGEYQHPSTHKGTLPMPLAGRVRHAFGQPRTGGLRWQGWLVDAGIGAEVRAIAYGRVAYADWLRGYGLLIIIDHGAGFMSLYGNNETLLFEVGDWVQPGTVISTVGEDPGTGQGLYFELREAGRAIDPAAWIARR